jgi:ADP-ribose pyrophosphatase YjhB (NUDIX family)
MSSLSVDEWMPNRLWSQVKRYMPIPCVDVIVENSSGAVLLGWRRILPYRNVWALPGGRVGKGERLQAAAERILVEYGLVARNLFLVGVFPIKFPSRSDLSVCLATNHSKGEVRPDGVEFSHFCWTRSLPRRTGANYKRMIIQWNKMKRNPQVLRFNRL